jgi:biotin carboxyl carrier protein
MFKITVNSQQTYEIIQDNGQLLLDGNPLNWDVQAINAHTFHILKDARSYTAEVLQADYEKKTFVIKINGYTYQIKAQDQLDLLLEKMGIANGGAAHVKEVKAPMPGLILDIKTGVGAEVKKGEVLLILEAMKMENAIKSPVDGIIKAIPVDRGNSVEKNQVLIQFE